MHSGRTKLCVGKVQASNAMPDSVQAYSASGRHAHHTMEALEIELGFRRPKSLRSLGNLPIRIVRPPRVYCIRQKTRTDLGKLGAQVPKEVAPAVRIAIARFNLHAKPLYPASDALTSTEQSQ